MSAYQPTVAALDTNCASALRYLKAAHRDKLQMAGTRPQRLLLARTTSLPRPLVHLAAGSALGSTDASAARFDAAAFGADFLAAAFLTTGLFLAATGAAFAPVRLFTGVMAFVVAGFAAFLGTLTAFAAFAAVFFARAGAFAASAGELFLANKASRFFTPAIQPGARPTPDQVFPVFGSTYFATDAVFAFAFDFFAARLLPTA